MTYDHMRRLIFATLKRMELPYHVWDEAESEAWVVIAAALDSYDESFGVPLAAHIALRLRWGLKDWVASSVKESADRLSGAELAPELDIDHDADCAVLLATVLDLCDTILTTKERICLLGTAVGLYPAEVSRLAKVNGKGIKANVASAREKLKIALKIGDEKPLLLLTDKV